MTPLSYTDPSIATTELEKFTNFFPEDVDGVGGVGTVGDWMGNDFDGWLGVVCGDLDFSLRMRLMGVMLLPHGLMLWGEGGTGLESR